MARWCARQGAATIRVWDSREAPPQAAALATDVPAATLFSGALGAGQLGDARLVLKSPGLAPTDARIAPLLDAARAQGLAVMGELDLFAHALADLKAARGYAPKVLAITGTNGKTTTTSLTAMLVERAGLRVGLAGNIGPTMLDTLAAALALEPAPEAAAAEQTEAEHETPEDVVGQYAEPAGDTDGAAIDAPGVHGEPADDTADGSEPGEEGAPLVLAPPPPKDPVFAHLPPVWVLELSSFQLDGVRGFEPSAATVLNISQDHLDWHGDMAAYAAAKARIFGEQGLMVINRDEPLVEAMVPAPQLVKGGRGKPAKAVGRAVLRFGLDAPQRPGDFGLVTEGGMAWLVRAMPADETIKRKKGEAEELIIQRLMPADALRIRGRHNASNALAALALATAIGCPLAPMLHGLREYRGEPHRVEPIGIVGGIEAVDDSKGTNVGATVAAIKGLGEDRVSSKLVVILGGDGKGQDFAPLAAPVQRHVRAVALIGRDAEAIAAALAGTGVPMQRHDTLEAAVPWCFAQAQEGDAVLLSPACASLDMFRNYAHRAQVFADAVQQLAHERGELLS
ncbi:UDP-N-acetylmuramoyl-L-alanine--D-glutamate ligase [Ideonella sp. 3Y2]|uniref:UDP-N-acetylmuramoylalanine--D-glutamate ligase n=2 Tax=Ideonella alba TaxID=2824118 RepID=A0A940YAB6_9BURK|nr:UDP-N-acetylmuramoyl-L-alanine--D-glutamate ligase [Ideonella alba]MBQ0931798.1 UDP-N-acetylmuramoyl-L-alanine--D-glutamate ligase [Ideonella alba]